MLKKLLGVHDQPRRAEPALHRAVLDERLLQRVQLVAVGQPFDGLDLGVLCFKGRVNARVDRLPVDDHGAGPALGFLAADLGARQPEVEPQHLGERPRFGHVEFVPASVDGQSELAHNVPLLKSNALGDGFPGTGALDGER